VVINHQISRQINAGALFMVKGFYLEIGRFKRVILSIEMG